MGKLFLQHTCLAEFEIMMQMVPRYIRKETMPENITYLEMLHRTVNDYQIRGLYKKIKKLTEGGDEYVMLFINTNHKNRFNNFYKHAEKRNWNVIKSNRNLAALFLLSGNEHLWKQIKSIVDEDTIDLKQVDIHSSNEEVYDVYQAVRFILYGAKNLTLEDLAEPEIIEDDIVLLITNSFIVNKYGVAPLENPHMRKRKVNRNVRKS
ncbi:MAG: hypothetical protein J6D15_04730 [Clostridia bacterium]|nr:hypothetical protein [Clostridia bacterium]